MARIDNELLNYQSHYLNGNVLKNKFGITEEEELNKKERIITTYKLAKLYLDPGKQAFDINHYLSIHKYLFEDIYEFAGEIRNENITKKIPFCQPQFIYQELNRVLKEAKRKISKITNKKLLLDFITELHSDLDVIHPFREGNGRTQREFIRQYMDFICKVNNLDECYLDYEKVDKDKYIDAVVKADATLNYTDLRNLFESILVIKQEEINKTK